MKRALSKLILTTTLLCLSVFVNAVSLKDFNYNQDGGYYEIRSVTDMLNLAIFVNSSEESTSGIAFKVLATELDFSGVNFTPIGCELGNGYISLFEGSFDGQGVVIKNLMIHREDAESIGLFGCSAGRIDGIVLDETCSIIGKKYVGGIVGYNYSGGQVSNCINKGQIKGEMAVGGVIGGGNESTINNCTNYGTINADSDSGGILGFCDKNTIQKCSNYGNVVGTRCIGGITGNLYSTSAIACHNYGEIVGSEKWIGGLFATIDDNSTVADCENFASVSGKQEIGGIAGYSYGSVRKCTNQNEAMVTGEATIGGIIGSHRKGLLRECNNVGAISGTGDVIGGIAGRSSGSIEECVNHAAISGINYIGGLVGSITVSSTMTGEVTSRGAINGCSNDGNVSGRSCVGGLVGTYGGGMIEGNRNAGGEINASMESGGAIVGTVPSFGGALSKNYYDANTIVIVNNSTYDGDTPRGAGGPNYDKAVPQDIVKMVYSEKTYYHCAVPASYEGQEIPEESNVSLDDFTYNNAGYYEIRSAEDVERLAEYVNSGHACRNLIFRVVVSELDFSSIESHSPIGYYKNESDKCYFAGTFDGNNAVIRNLKVSSSCLFRDNEGIIQNVIIDSSFQSTTTERSISTIVGNNRGTIKNCVNNASFMSSSSWAAGICYSNSGTITDCVNNGNITAYRGAGGIAAMNSGNIKDCTNTGDITYTLTSDLLDATGGITGSNNYDGVIDNCINRGVITGTKVIGGIVGSNYKATIQDCTNYGKVVGSDSYVGGIAASSDEGGAVIKCTNIADVSGECNVGGIIGYTSNSCKTTECCNSGNVSASAPGFMSDRVGGIVGTNNDSSISNCKVTAGVISGNDDTAGAIVGQDNVGAATLDNRYLRNNYYYYNVKVILGGTICEKTAPRGIGGQHNVTRNNGAMLSMRTDAEITPFEEIVDFSFNNLQEYLNRDYVVVDNIYCNYGGEGDNAYDDIEQCLLLTRPIDGSTIIGLQGKEVSAVEMMDNYCGIVFEVPTGAGVISVDAQTLGNYRLSIKVGSLDAQDYWLTTRETIDVSYSANEPAYVYIYASTTESFSSRSSHSWDDAVKIFGLKWHPGGTDIFATRTDSVYPEEDCYALGGLKVNGKNKNKGIYICKGRKLLVR